MWIVYMLSCRDGSLYTGITNDLRRRLARHRAGTASAYTRARRPVRLVYEERQPDRRAALRREAALRRLSRDEKLMLVREGRGGRHRARSTG
ncbi:MAG TPA: GIY-YIG nuclease family protein [Gemmatimonadales bacterium]|nr:GIY-YIG nuclease family protein [Gemmatimonadales bacterium]